MLLLGLVINNYGLGPSLLIFSSKVSTLLELSSNVISTLFLNKKNYINNHYLLRPIILKNKIENYIRDMIRRDYDLVFEQILLENYKRWLEIKHYMYKNIIYKNYIYFIKDFCIENESNKCRSLINLFLKEHGLCQNQHKNNIIKNKRWKI